MSFAFIAPFYSPHGAAAYSDDTRYCPFHSNLLNVLGHPCGVVRQCPLRVARNRHNSRASLGTTGKLSMKRLQKEIQCLTWASCKTTAHLHLHPNTSHLSAHTAGSTASPPAAQAWWPNGALDEHIPWRVAQSDRQASRSVAQAIMVVCTFGLASSIDIQSDVIVTRQEFIAK